MSEWERKSVERQGPPTLPSSQPPLAEAASVLLARGPGSPEVFLVSRAPTLRFLGGFHAFPGGKVHADDARLAREFPGLSSRQVAAIRELFEETGVLLAHHPDGTFPRADAALDSLRRELLADRLPFEELLAQLQLALEPADLTEAGSLVTPAFSPYRFDTTFFLATLPAGQSPQVLPGELTSGAWSTAAAALAAWEAGTLLLSPPTVALLELVRGAAIEDLPQRLPPLLEKLASGSHPPIWFSPGVQMIPLRCQGLLPGSYTNTYLVGTGPRYLLDPGPADPAEQERLFQAVEVPGGEDHPLEAVVLTHHHPDHVGAALACARRYHVPVLAHPQTARMLAGQVPVDREVAAGDRLDLGRAPHGRGRWHLEAVHTPGHAPGHLVFYEPAYQLLFAGDMVSTLSSVVIAPPEGDLAAYIDSLRRLRDYPARLLLPAHGSPSARPAFVLEECLDHRHQREEQLLQALGTEPRAIPDLVLELYRGLPAGLMRLAELQTLAGLQKLEREGRARPATADGAAWVATNGMGRG